MTQVETLVALPKQGKPILQPQILLYMEAVAVILVKVLFLQQHSLAKKADLAVLRLERVGFLRFGSLRW